MTMSITFNRPEKTVTLCTRLDLQSAHEQAVAALQAAQREQARDPREVSTDVAEKAAEVQRLEAEMRDHEIVFTLRAWPRKRWVEFEETHPPRKDNDADKALSINVASLDDALASKGDLPLSIVSAKSRAGDDVPFDPRTDWAPLADELTNGQWEQFAIAVLNVNRGVTAAPFSPLASAVTRRSEQTSRRQSA
jgi:hypothetical protein